MTGNGNGHAIGLPITPEMLERLLGGGNGKPTSPEQRQAEAKGAFDRVLDEALGGCPGSREDEDHRNRDEAILTLLRSSFNVHTLPEPVAAAVLKVLAFNASHRAESIEDFGKNLQALFSGWAVSDAMLVAGAVLRVKDLPDTRGVAEGKNGHGQYL